MECPAVFLFLVVYLQGAEAWNTVPLVFLAMWQIHYVNRTLVYPFRIRTGRRFVVFAGGMPCTARRDTRERGEILGDCFNVLNAYVNARFVSHFIGEYGAECSVVAFMLYGPSEPCYPSS